MIWWTRRGPRRPSTFNVSTTAALVAAGAGCPVAKHGNRSSTSLSGSADLLEALGVDIEITPEKVAASTRRPASGFMFAPRHHKAMAHGAGPQGAGGANDLQLHGTTDQPAGARRQLMGVSGSPLPGVDRRGAGRSRHRTGFGRFRRRRHRRISITGPTRIIEVVDGGTSEWFGLARRFRT